MLGRQLAGLSGRAVLKSARMGYDGKGQVTVSADTLADKAWRLMGAPRGILESFVDFRCEISVIVARSVELQLVARRGRRCGITVDPQRESAKVPRRAFDRALQQREFRDARRCHIISVRK